MTLTSPQRTATSWRNKLMVDTASRRVEEFEQLEMDTPTFGHREHVGIAYEMLGIYDFVTACNRYASTIKRMAEQHGAPEKFNTTITFAFMSLIGERKAQMEGQDFEQFLAANTDLLDKDILMNWYSKDRLTSKKAREQFLLPDKAA